MNVANMDRMRVICCVLALLAAAPGVARFRIPEIEQVPVDRLIANLEGELAQVGSPFDPAEVADIRRKIARAHALAYARGVTTLPVRAGTNVVQEPPGGPGFLQSLQDQGQRIETARYHLLRTLSTYEEILNADRYDIRSRLGYAWALEQFGQEQAALEQYRIVAAAAWPVEQDFDSLGGDEGLGLYAGEKTIFQEAATAVLRYLDPAADADEIAELETRVAAINEIGRWVTPILVPLDARDGFHRLVDPQACVAFDLDGSGLARRWGWITPRAAWLVWDPEGSGHIDSGLQLFGSVGFFIFWDNGYEALAALDDDRDGRLEGAELDGLALWADGNGDGISDPGEVRPVTSHGVIAIATGAQEHENGFPYNPAGIELADGATRASYDWIARSDAGDCDGKASKAGS